MLREITEKEYKEQYASTQKGTYLLVFHALWCPPCRNFKHSLEELAQKDGVDIFRIDVDENRQLPGEFGVKNLPTWFIMKDGEVVEKVVGYHPYSELKEFVSKHL
ncbi:thioredoxin [Mycoplasmopsis californica HAZ160_1]|uniref:Thioredoxin n=1 Tax=Mycoplasmopsis californica HAZ160_1 TaxID=1397850 RepID=A0AAT9F7D1_9BACT|nr:thioredoxin family protein [Mycoplasmopsis californica]BAP00786.1 thioredoxin [Mycoplasmopsis californica HAZ160_1]BBG40640.1 thioredoxin [Mycoplasmopsis californica]BBG41235.1 thioredoxin [Mycoplasmopsis californica]BBG41828.1 thioredoxin [Mycoplasmopsis californica]BBG42422.1 thioredoxin [Mycoplasmopsis californica]